MRKVLFLLMVFASAAIYAQQKFALVIGNGSYTNFGSLRNAVNDANDMADALQGLGFTVDKVLNGNLNQMETAAIRLRDRLTGAGNNSYGFFYYAGHGVQVDGVNYLIPANANIPDKDFLRERAVSAQALLDMLNRSKNALNIFVLDACRDFPAAWSRSVDRGLAVMHPPSDSIVMFATAAGRTASDGTGRNGLFTSHLLRHLKTPGIEVNDVFRRTMRDVASASNNEQRPAMYTDFAETAFLGTRPAPAQPAAATQTTQPAQPTQPTQPAQPATTNVQPQQPQQTQPAAATQRPASGNMVRINGGTFTMGSPANEPNRNSDEVQRRITVSTFNMGKFEVTQKEYEEIMGNNPSNFKGADLPVERVTWFDAIEYCIKRSQREGLTPAYTMTGRTPASGHPITAATVTWNRQANGYRLPTEAEWEYACRAGTTTPFNTGNNITTSQANYDGNYPYNNNAKGTYRERTTAVGTFPANAWGLHDMHGNVREWCWDWYGAYPSGAQTNPMGASSGSHRVFRGGSWYDLRQYVRSAYRRNSTPSSRDRSLGFRLVRP